MQALSEKMMRFQQKHSAFAVAMNNSSCSIPIARSMQKSAVAFWVTVLLFCFIGPTYRTGH